MLSSKFVVRLTIYGDKDRRLEVGPWSLDVVAYVVAVLLRRESGFRPLAGIDTQPRTLDVLVIDDPLAVAGRDVVAARVVRNFDDFPEELVRLLLALRCSRVSACPLCGGRGRRGRLRWPRIRQLQWLLPAPGGTPSTPPIPPA